METTETQSLAVIETGLKQYMRSLAERLSTGALTAPEAAQLYGHLKMVEDGIKNMTGLAAEQLKAYVRQEGTRISDAGTLRAQLGAYEVEARVRNTGYDPSKVQLLLRRKGLAETAGCDAEIKYKPNAEKLNALVAEGRLAAADVQACHYDIEYNLQRPRQVGSNE